MYSRFASQLNNTELRTFTIFYSKQKQVCSLPGKAMLHLSRLLASNTTLRNGSVKEQKIFAFLAYPTIPSMPWDTQGCSGPMAVCFSPLTSINSNTKGLSKIKQVNKSHRWLKKNLMVSICRWHYLDRKHYEIHKKKKKVPKTNT